MQLKQLALSSLLLLGSTTSYCTALLCHTRSRILSRPSPTAVVCVTLDSNAEELRAKAQKLRDEADQLESSLDRNLNLQSISATQANAVRNVITYTSLNDSTWALRYRFASDAEPLEKDDKGKGNSISSTSSQQLQPSTYSGTLTVQFRSDGYTNLVGHESTGAGPGLEIIKVWGWDEERAIDNEYGNTGNAKNEDYLLFSTTVKLPSSDTIAPNQQLRFYWQGRLDKALTTNELSVLDGTVTIKKDIVPLGGGFWGIFRGSAGILAQFRQVGNFAAKPTAK